jgi:hypothetical protein
MSTAPAMSERRRGHLMNVSGFGRTILFTL